MKKVNKITPTKESIMKDLVLMNIDSDNYKHNRLRPITTFNETRKALAELLKDLRGLGYIFYTLPKINSWKLLGIQVRILTKALLRGMKR